MMTIRLLLAASLLAGALPARAGFESDAEAASRQAREATRKRLDPYEQLKGSVKRGDVEGVRKALASHPDPDAKPYDVTPLMLAARDGEVEIAAVLIEAGADVNAGEEDLITPLKWAAYRGHAGVARLLIEHHARVDAQGLDGSTALMVASWHGHAEFVEALIEARADANLKDPHYGRTALMLAAVQGHAAVVEALLKAPGIDKGIQDDEGRSAADYAAAKGHDAVASRLR